ncbi:endocuticle structural glycoprotein SgAbd-2-like [Anopheles albimanus]|uniref:Endocuticle structural glycoprotein SgAbd-2 n=1 Tax=Anopheles albimanus TaxID=7167 RepID=A0A182FN62_ANOAL|nr:endocuticle structural glycoprotein SgAbd-2-like [Anopheles albimanus]
MKLSIQALKLTSPVLMLLLLVQLPQHSPVFAAPAEAFGTTPVAIVSQSSTVNPDGSFISAFESADGIKVEDEGQVKTIEVPSENGNQQATVVVQRGTYSYFAPDGTPISVQWTADEGGFRAQGAHLPVAPGERPSF